MTLIAAQKRTISNLAVGLNYQLVTVTGAIDRKRQTASEHRELLLKLVLIVLPFFSDIFEACQNDNVADSRTCDYSSAAVGHDGNNGT